MEKLIERESPTRNPLVAAPALAVQFFLIPMAVVAVTVVAYFGFRSLLTDRRAPQDYLAEVRNGSRGGRWLAAMELWQVMADPKTHGDRAFGAALVQAFDDSKGDDPRVRQYLALAIGHAALGENDAAFAALDQATQRSADVVLSSLYFPQFDSLHSDPRWAALLKRMKLE